MAPNQTTTRKRKPGRPPADPERPLGRNAKMVSALFPPADAARLAEVAAERGTSVSALIRGGVAPLIR
jgi:hypothetical protein